MNQYARGHPLITCCLRQGPSEHATKRPRFECRSNQHVDSIKLRGVGFIPSTHFKIIDTAAVLMAGTQNTLQDSRHGMAERDGFFSVFFIARGFFFSSQESLSTISAKPAFKYMAVSFLPIHLNFMPTHEAGQVDGHFYF